MKYTSLLVPVLAAAALAAVSDTPSPLATLWDAEAETAGSAPNVDPPWLTQSGSHEHDAHDGTHPAHDGIHAGHDHAHEHVHGADVAAGDPHAGIYAATDPHAAVHADHDPHAALYASGDPHAAVHGAAGVHSAPHAAGGAHVALDPHAADPHAADPYAVDPHAAAPHAGRPRAAAPRVVSVERSRAANGLTIADVFAQRTALAEKRVTVRATVVKATDGVLGKTYLHLQDGSGSAELATHDLTATTTEAFELGETVEVEGVLAIDQDVGLDYRYPALLSDVKRVH